MKLFRSRSAQTPRHASKRRKTLGIVASGVAIIAVPALLFQLALYRQNLAITGDTLPKAAPLQKDDRLLIVSPHLDDETLGAGGAIATAREKGIPVRVVFITNGDGSRSTQIVEETREFEAKLEALAPSGWMGSTKKRVPLSTPSRPSSNLFERIAKMRQGEAIAAMKQLGLAPSDLTFLGYPDGGTRTMWETNWSSSRPYFSTYTKTTHSPYANSYTKKTPYSGATVASDLEKIIGQWKPTVVMTTHPEDTHPDHWAAYAYTLGAIETLSGKTKDLETIRLKTFLVHHGPWPTPGGFHPEAALTPPAGVKDIGTKWQQSPLSKRAVQAKNAALNCYVSQLVFTPLYLRSFVRRNELFGIVPASNVDDKKGTLLRDGDSDSMWRQRWAAADIRSIDYVFTKRNGEAGFVTLVVHLAKTSSARIGYRLSLHSIDGEKVNAWTVSARRDGNALRATLTKQSGARLSTQPLGGKLTNDGFSIDLPLDALQIAKPDSRLHTLLVSANTQIGNTRLDQTATAALRFPVEKE